MRAFIFVSILSSGIDSSSNISYSPMCTRPPTNHIAQARPDLPRPRRGLTHHLCLLFLESLTNSFASCHEFLYTSRDAAGFTGNEGFGGEIVDAGVEAVSDEVGEHLCGGKRFVSWFLSWECQGKIKETECRIVSRCADCSIYWIVWR